MPAAAAAPRRIAETSARLATRATGSARSAAPIHCGGNRKVVRGLVRLLADERPAMLFGSY
jgi:hypothetical protein